MKHFFADFELQKKVISITQVPKDENTEGDSLSKLAVVGEQHLMHGFPFNEINSLTVEQEEYFPIKLKDTWMTPIFCYLTMGTLPEYKLETKRLVLKASNYGKIDGWMFKRAYLPL